MSSIFEHHKLDLVKDIIFFFVTVAVTFGYVMLLLLIISFITLSYLHFNIEGMMIFSGICAAVAGVFYIVKTVKKWHK